MAQFGMRPGIILLREGTDTSQVRRYDDWKTPCAMVQAIAYSTILYTVLIAASTRVNYTEHNQTNSLPLTS